MSYDRITITNIDNNLFSGSRDALRTEFGLYHEVVTDTEGHTKIVKNTVDVSDWFMGFSVGGIAAHQVSPSTYLSIMQTRNFGPYETASANIATKTRKLHCRLIGDEAHIESDLQWKTLLLGGEYNQKVYKNIFETGTFDDHSYDYQRPLSITKAKELASAIDSITSYQNFFNYEIGYNYYYHLPGYENVVKDVNNLLMPNVYMLYMVANPTETISLEAEYPKYMRDFVSTEGTYDSSSLDKLFVDAKTTEPPPHTDAVYDDSIAGNPLYEDRTKRFRDYLSTNYASASYSNSTVNNIIEGSSTLYYDTDFADTWFKSVHENIHRMPVSAFVRFPIEGAFEGAEPTWTTPGTTYYTDIIKNNSLEEDMLYFLKNNFGTSNQQLNFVQEELMLHGDSEDETGDTVYIYNTKLSDNKKSSVDFLAALGSIYESTLISKESDGIFMGPRTLNTVTTENIDSKFSYYKRQKSMRAIEDTIAKMNDIISATDGQYDIRYILNTLEENKGPAETIAYRLKKTGGSFLDSNRQVTTLQNMYFINDDALRADSSDMIYHDTQVKMGEEYSYTLYAYVVIPGYQYKYDNLRISRQIGTVSVRDSTGSFAPTTEDQSVCIEFYDPTTNNAASQLLETETNLLGTEHLVVESDSNIDVFRYAYIHKEDVTIADCLPGVDPAVRFDTYRESKGGIDYEALFGLSGPIDFMDGISILATIAPEPGTKLVKLFLDNPSLYAPLTTADGGAIPGDPRYQSWRKAWGGLPDASGETVGGLTPLGREVELILYRAWAARVKTYEYDGHGTHYIEKFTEPLENRFATNAQIKSEYKYLADYNFTYAPSVKIIEIPVATKTIRIMDHPPVAPDVTPYQRKDDSQIIGFYVRTESFRVPTNPTDTTTLSSFGIYPTALNNEELLKEQVYKTSNNMIAGEQISKNSVSKPSMLEVYRLDEKPNSISDFNGNLVFTKDLSIESMPSQKHTSCFYEEKIRTNKKYYYLFRFLNENGDGGYLAPIQVAELVNDGGYKYTKFDVIYESELGQMDNRQDTTQFKKLLQITPSIDHLRLDDANVDYSQPAATQMQHLQGMVGNAQDLIWGKTFKFRITSKKTGKKIDLNIKYNLRDS